QLTDALSPPSPARPGYRMWASEQLSSRRVAPGSWIFPRVKSGVARPGHETSCQGDRSRALEAASLQSGQRGDLLDAVLAEYPLGHAPRLAVHGIALALRRRLGQRALIEPRGLGEILQHQGGFRLGRQPPVIFLGGRACLSACSAMSRTFAGTPSVADAAMRSRKARLMA